MKLLMTASMSSSRLNQQGCILRVRLEKRGVEVTDPSSKTQQMHYRFYSHSHLSYRRRIR
jgi:hypothetical protein